MSLLAPTLSVSTISRNPSDYTRTRQSDPFKPQRSLDPSLHPFAKEREYVRALNAAKLQRVFAKPFICSLEGHTDGVFSLSTIKKDLLSFASGSANGELKLWDLNLHSCQWTAQAHNGFVKSIASNSSGSNILTCGTDATVKIFAVDQSQKLKNLKPVEPNSVFTLNSPLTSITSHQNQNELFAVSSSSVHLFDSSRSEPIHEFTWSGADSINCVRFSPCEENLLLSSSSDRNVVLYDIRSKSAAQKLILKMQTNDLSWNPQNAFNFVSASEDSNCYLFDVRHLKSAITIYEDHVGAVISCDIDPTGTKLVSGSYDKTVRLFNLTYGHSYDVYHNRRQQRVFGVKFTFDSKYVISGSEDTNVRIWKSVSHEKVGRMTPSEVTATNYKNQLVERYKHLPEIKKVESRRLIPQAIKNQKHLRHEIKQSQQRKDERRRKHMSSEKANKFQSKRKQTVRIIEE